MRSKRKSRKNPPKTVTWGRRKWERQDDGTWVDLATGLVDPLAEDMTISNFYNFRVITYGERGSFVEVPISMAHNEDDLEWTLKYQEMSPQEEGEGWKGRKPKKILDYLGRPVILVPVSAWDRMADKIGSIGMWHPGIR